MPHCYVIRTLRVLLNFKLLSSTDFNSYVQIARFEVVTVMIMLMKIKDFWGATSLHTSHSSSQFSFRLFSCWISEFIILLFLILSAPYSINLHTTILSTSFHNFDNSTPLSRHPQIPWSLPYTFNLHPHPVDEGTRTPETSGTT